MNFKQTNASTNEVRCVSKNGNRQTAIREMSEKYEFRTVRVMQL
jgi:hypothetical protein